MAADDLFPEKVRVSEGKKKERLSGETLFEIELDVAGVTSVSNQMKITQIKEERRELKFL